MTHQQKHIVEQARADDQRNERKRILHSRTPSWNEQRNAHAIFAGSKQAELPQPARKMATLSETFSAMFLVKGVERALFFNLAKQMVQFFQDRETKAPTPVKFKLILMAYKLRRPKLEA
jgi:hypothetical protein